MNAQNPATQTGVHFMISDDKASHLAHLALGALKKSPSCRFTEDDGKVLREIKRVVAAELLLEARSIRKYGPNWRPTHDKSWRGVRSGT
jgi:hypothetical protein